MDTEKFKMGWLMVAFDLPVLSKEQRKRATDFRNFLRDDGYSMMQWSVYVTVTRGGTRSCLIFATLS